MTGGDVVVQGYAQKETRTDPWCQTDCTNEDCTESCDTFTYVRFVVQATGTQEFIDFLASAEGNAYVGARSIGLGCLENGIIRYENASDAEGMRSFTLDESLSEDILESSAAKPIVLRLEKDLYTTGMGAPACYSHITRISRFSP